MPGHSRSDGLGPTRVGLAFVILLGVVLIAALNTGNNGLYLVLAAMAGVVVFSQVAAVLNVRKVDVRVEPPSEAWAGRAAVLGLELQSRRRWLGHRLLRLEIEAGDLEPSLGVAGSARTAVPGLAPGTVFREEIGLKMPRRGLYRLRRIRVRSLHPFGFFRKGLARPCETEILVYPTLLPRGLRLPVQPGRAGEDPTRRAGWGHELLGLRSFRVGDDPRDIHWKQTARIGDLVVKERETERSHRLRIVLDNGVGGAASEGDREHFEELVSEAATAAVDHLEQGHEVALSTRDGELPFAAGRVQRRRILEALARIEIREDADGELPGDDGSMPSLRLALADPPEAA